MNNIIYNIIMNYDVCNWSPGGGEREDRFVNIMIL
jgi:hypothetical protein